MVRPSPIVSKGQPPAFMERVLSSLPAALMIVDPNGRILEVMGALNAIARGTSSDLVGTNLVEYVDDAERAIVSELLQVISTSPESETVGPARVTYFDRDGAKRATEVWGINRSKDPEIKGICVILLPESAYDRFDQVLTHVVQGAALEQTFGTLAQALRYPPVVSESFFVMPGTDDRGIVRVPDLAEVPGPPGPGPWDEVWESDEPGIHRQIGQLSGKVRERAKKARFSSVSCFPVGRGVDGRAAACLVVWSRGAEAPPLNSQLAIDRAAGIAALAISHASVEAGLRDAAYRDALTGLGNRRSFFEALEAQVNAGEQPAVLYIDLDGFKAVNDSLGHLAGDAVLRVAARRLASVMRPTDELARLGGDEFAVLCGSDVSRDQVTAIANRLVEQLNRPLSVGDGQSVDCGASVGIAVGLPPGTLADTIIGHADRALYQAKAKGRGQWAFDDSI
jgi:diguanylate cyclase (GGDEF)-like protein